MALYELPAAGKTVSKRCIDTSRYTSMPSLMAKEKSRLQSLTCWHDKRQERLLEMYNAKTAQ